MGWRVVRQLPSVDTDANGNTGPGVRVTFTTDDGLTDSLFFVRADYNPATVKAAIAAEVANHDEITGLTG